MSNGEGHYWWAQLLVKQKAVDRECYITTVLFNNGCELLHDRIDNQRSVT